MMLPCSRTHSFEPSIFPSSASNGKHHGSQFRYHLSSPSNVVSFFASHAPLPKLLLALVSVDFFWTLRAVEEASWDSEIGSGSRVLFSSLLDGSSQGVVLLHYCRVDGVYLPAPAQRLAATRKKKT